MTFEEKKIFISWLEKNKYKYGTMFDSVVDELIKKLNEVERELHESLSR